MNQLRACQHTYGDKPNRTTGKLEYFLHVTSFMIVHCWTNFLQTVSRLSCNGNLLIPCD